MPSIHRALLAGTCALALLTGCNIDVVSLGSGSANISPTGSAASGGGGGSGTVGLNAGGGSTPATDSVNATSAVVGTVTVMTGASQTITVAFTSADGRPISGLALSSTTLPPDWSGAGGFTCTVAGSGNNCVLTLTYAPKTQETGTLTIGYVYVGDQIAPPGASISIPYAATTSDNIVATAAPIGQINAAVGTGNQSVSINFTTDDGNAATGLTMLSNLSSLPAGWSAATPGFSCAIVSNGSGCQLVLNYVPKVAGRGTLTLNYGYTDASGVARTGAINLPYATTTNGNVNASVSPVGQVNAIQTTGTQAVTVTFTTDNAAVAHNLVLLAPAATLPAGWSGPVSGFTCGTVSTGSGCQLALTYAPTALTSGTLTLDYGYTSPGGEFTTGSVDIPYAATSSDNVVATAAPSGQIDAIVGELSTNVLATFTTDDARTATALQLTTNLAALPAGWSSSDSSFSCAGVGGGTTCQLPLMYIPTAADNGTLTLRYTYQDNAGQSKSGSLNLAYRATTDDSIVAAPGPASLAVVTGTSNPLTVTFATDDGNPASLLSVTSGLTPLPAGWSSTADSFTCSSVSVGVSCQLALTYQPTNPDSGTLTLGFTYTNDSGSVKTGTVLIPYTAVPPGP
ncbi:MAG TPA: hypothetical protein VGV09_02755 [Steroidobacteraceae bacterium]|nr:hypothetical protein [Steroidobacteraceae bacterium]